ncbi:uncharacterized protein LAESUDRAFT_724670 [Laetiporus sulphureus 93-53]|uniref:Uncharacterized protein n=1 Tax=Laetiporus sulphureus 93-53 TaxID=1314785 RepID=A0A165EST4_9APHY|nr:uncharacterized protein LAESUDRAFT_724670 [Laetiporus sulphureus 93-53]KZT07684.1 hypothetical protein LAESUDRAFT_724670 [Laetiporus sulphureus 93-53]
MALALTRTGADLSVAITLVHGAIHAGDACRRLLVLLSHFSTPQSIHANEADSRPRIARFDHGRLGLPSIAEYMSDGYHYDLLTKSRIAVIVPYTSWTFK